MSFTLEELEGVPEDVISGFTKRTDESGKEVYDVTHKTPDIFPIVCTYPFPPTEPLVTQRDSSPFQFKFAQLPLTRQLAYESYEDRLKINTPIFEKMLGLRRQIASLLGYDTWADYRTEVKMVKTAKGVVDVSLEWFNHFSYDANSPVNEPTYSSLATSSRNCAPLVSKSAKFCSP